MCLTSQYLEMGLLIQAAPSRSHTAKKQRRDSNSDCIAFKFDSLKFFFKFENLYLTLLDLSYFLLICFAFFCSFFLFKYISIELIKWMLQNIFFDYQFQIKTALKNCYLKITEKPGVSFAFTPKKSSAKIISLES